MCGKTVQGGEVEFGEFLVGLGCQFSSGLADAGQEVVVLALELMVVGGQRIGMVVCLVLESANVCHLAGLGDAGAGEVAEVLYLVDVLALKIG